MRSAVAIPYQGRRNVARNNPAAEAWGIFVRSHLARLKMSQANFGRRMDAAGYGISKQTVSQWANGENAPDANTALAVAQALGARDTEALRAAGFALVAQRMEEQGVRVEPADPVVEEIMLMKHLSMRVRQTLIDQYTADRAMVERRAREMAQTWAAQDDDDEDGTAA